MGQERERTTWKGLLAWLSGRSGQNRDLVREMEELIEEGTAEGILDEEQEDMLLSVLSFRTTMVREVMVPRTEMICVDVSLPLSEFVRRMVEEGHSRVPIF